MASRRSEIRAERKALKEKEALQNASSGLKHKFTVVDALMYAFIAILSLICLYPFVNVIAYSLSGADAVLANDVTFYPKDFTLAAYKNIAARPTIWISLRVTIIITIAGTALGLVLLYRDQICQEEKCFQDLFCLQCIFQVELFQLS